MVSAAMVYRYRQVSLKSSSLRFLQWLCGVRTGREDGTGQVHCDNAAVVGILNSGDSKDTQAMPLYILSSCKNEHQYVCYLYKKNWPMHYPKDAAYFLHLHPQANPLPSPIKTSRDFGFINSEAIRLEVSRLDQAVDFYFRQRLAPSIHKVYSSAQKRYSDYCSLHHLLLLPVSEEQVCKFISYLADTKLLHLSIKVYLSVLRQLHIANNHPDPKIGDMTKLDSGFRGCNPPPSQNHPEQPHPTASMAYYSLA